MSQTRPDADALAELRRLARLAPSQWRDAFPTRRPVSYLCTYVPVEILHAAGLTPVRLNRRPGGSGSSGACLQSCTCSLARSVVEQALDGNLEGLSGVAFCHTRDTLQATADIWRLRFPQSCMDVVNLPTVLDSPPRQDVRCGQVGALSQQAVGTLWNGGRRCGAERKHQQLQLAGHAALPVGRSKGYAERRGLLQRASR